jgi:hypothetical protein
VLFALLAAAMAAVLAAEPTTPNEVYRRAAADLFANVPPAKRRVTRYLALNAIPEGERWRFIQAIDFALNSVSFRGQMYHAAEVGEDQLLLRVDLTGLGWDRDSRAARRARLKLSGVDLKLEDDIWEQIVRDDPYWKVDQTNAKGKYLKGWIDPALEEQARLATYSSSFILRADWLFPRLLTETDQGGYYSALLMIPPAEADLYRSLGVDEKLINRDPQLKSGGAVLKSIVALHNRELQMIPILYGYDHRVLWRTFDVLNDSDAKKSVLETFGGKIAHDGREIIYTLPNGLHAYALYDAKGKQVFVVPQEIALDMRPKAANRDRNVRNGVSCMYCHTPVAGIQPFVDTVRTAILDDDIGLAVLSNDYRKIVEVTEDLEAYYKLAEKGGIERDIVQQQESYHRRVEEANGLDPAACAERVVRYFDGYVWDLVTAEQARREMGVTEEVARAAWRASGNSQLMVLSTGQAIRRTGWEKSYPVGMRELHYAWEKAVAHPN